MKNLISLLLFFSSILVQAQQAPRVLFLAGEGFNTDEFWIPWFSISGAGYEIDVASYMEGTVIAGSNDRIRDYQNPISLEEVDPNNYIALVIPGGYSPANLEKYPRALEIAEIFMNRQMPVGAICHGPRILARQGLLDDRVATALVNVKDEMPHQWQQMAFGQYLDQEVVIDGALITSRYPLDSNPFAVSLLNQYAELGYLPVRKTQPNILVINAGVNRMQYWAFIGSGLVNNGANVIRTNPEDLDEVDDENIDFVCLVGEDIPSQLLRKVKRNWKNNHIVVESNDHEELRKDLVKTLEAAHSLTTNIRSEETEEIEAIIVIRDQFDDEVFIQAKNYLQGAGIPFRVVSDKKGWITGLRGLKALSESSFNELENLANEITIFLPGGFWTLQAYQETEEQNAAYIKWALNKWEKGATLMAFGSDPWRLLNRKEFEGVSVAASDMYRWKFQGSAKYTDERVINSTDRIITAKGAPDFFNAIKRLK